MAFILPVNVSLKITVTMASHAASLTLTAYTTRSAVAKVIAVCFPYKSFSCKMFSLKLENQPRVEQIGRP